MTETRNIGAIYPKLLSEMEIKLPLKCEMAPVLIKDTVKLIKESKRSLSEWMKDGYIEMSQINLELANYGVEQDLRDLILYEASLIGRGI